MCKYSGYCLFVKVFVSTKRWSERDLKGLDGCFLNIIGEQSKSETVESVLSKEQTEEGDWILENEGELKWLKVWLWKDVTDSVSLRSLASFKLDDGSRS